MGNSPKHGFRLVKVLSGSPAEAASLQPYIDFVMEVNGTSIVDSQMSLLDMLNRNENCRVTLTVWNIVTKTTRDVKVDLNRDWGGEGVLGARLSLQTINSDTTELLHVTEVEVGSPAAEAGLKALEDYIIGTPQRAVTSADSLAILAECRKEFALVVYNRGSQTVREVTVRPSSNWGGKGVLGCQVGEGLLHQPQILRP